MTRMLVPGAAVAALLCVSAKLAAAARLIGLAPAAWWARQHEPGLAGTEILYAVQRSKTIIEELQPLPGSGYKFLDFIVSGS
ncbi:hypothetical protein QTH89_07210 [Variovorax sp. J22G21]|uniref:hypothetical protein n=1 Tax=Variovorax fucosicus TaxID=3053517 RepID=UPI002578C1AA|nr:MULTISPECIES: hypothetical protein [unclassified Variovorax]MDM0042387.1 hypothetical protein [Variovorax sp. J22R193]MDM0060992.1 hypothetical protein [Variovorax sp. J22G21]